jgi:hypothetical protein
MNVWKPIALCSIAGLAGSLCIQTAVAAAPSITAGPCHDQPNMAAALEHLKGSRASLEKAEHNKGGWRDRAIQRVDDALKETNTGCMVANTP